MSATRKLLALPVIGLLMLAGCGSENNDEKYVCVDKTTNTRVDEDRCDDNDSNMGWWLLAAGAAYPSYGGSVARNSGKLATPKSNPKPLPSKAGSVPKASTGSGSGSKSNNNKNGGTSKGGTNLSKPNSGGSGSKGGSSGSGGRVGGGSVGGGVRAK